MDLAIYIQNKPGKKEALEEELKLEGELEDKIKQLPVDVRTLNYSPLYFRYKVFRDGKLILNKDETIKSDFESLSIREYHDFNFYRKRYMRGGSGNLNFDEDQVTRNLDDEVVYALFII